jgi:TATA-binding protein-associated factor Taf7
LLSNFTLRERYSSDENEISSPREPPEEGPAEAGEEDPEKSEQEEEEEEDLISEQSDSDDPIAARISERSQRLQERSTHVEDAIKAIANLHMAYRHGHADGLSVRDLELKRGQLRMEVCEFLNIFE